MASMMATENLRLNTVLFNTTRWMGQVRFRSPQLAHGAEYQCNFHRKCSPFRWYSTRVVMITKVYETKLICSATFICSRWSFKWMRSTRNWQYGFFLFLIFEWKKKKSSFLSTSCKVIAKHMYLHDFACHAQRWVCRYQQFEHEINECMFCT